MKERTEGLKEWRRERVKERRTEGLKERRTEGEKDWGRKGLKEWRREGLKEWRGEGEKDWRTKGEKNCRTEGVKERRSEGKKEWRREWEKDWRSKGLKERRERQWHFLKGAELLSFKWLAVNHTIYNWVNLAGPTFMILRVFMMRCGFLYLLNMMSHKRKTMLKCFWAGRGQMSVGGRLLTAASYGENCIVVVRRCASLAGVLRHGGHIIRFPVLPPCGQRVLRTHKQRLTHISSISQLCKCVSTSTAASARLVRGFKLNYVQMYPFALQLMCLQGNQLITLSQSDAIQIHYTS